MTHFYILQLEDDGHMSEDTNTVYQSIRGHNWFRPDEPLSYVMCSLESLTKPIAGFDARSGIPVGSIEFVEKALQTRHNIPKLRGIYIPAALRQPEFLGRRIATVTDKEEITALFREWRQEYLFIKSASVLKCDYADIYTARNKLPDDDRYFVSERVDIESEWRVFVHRGIVEDVRNYAGDPWLVPGKGFVEHAVRVYADAPTAYVLDVAVLKSGATVVIEVHNFAACGLYGFHANLPAMIRDGFKHELCAHV